MKKVLALILVLGLVLSLSGATCLPQVQDRVCNPPAAVMAVVNAAAPLAAVAITIAVPGSAAYVNAVSVMQAVTAIQAGVCVSVTQLNALIAWLQSDEARGLEAKANLKKGPAKATAINVQPLIDWRDQR